MKKEKGEEIMEKYCANCAAVFDKEIIRITTIKVHIQDRLHNGTEMFESLKITDLITGVYNISVEELNLFAAFYTSYNCDELHSNSRHNSSSSRSTKDLIEMALCHECASLLSCLYRAHRDFDKLSLKTPNGSKSFISLLKKQQRKPRMSYDCYEQDVDDNNTCSLSSIEATSDDQKVSTQDRRTSSESISNSLDTVVSAELCHVQDVKSSIDVKDEFDQPTCKDFEDGSCKSPYSDEPQEEQDDHDTNYVPTNVELAEAEESDNEHSDGEPDITELDIYTSGSHYEKTSKLRKRLVQKSSESQSEKKNCEFMAVPAKIWMCPPCNKRFVHSFGLQHHVKTDHTCFGCQTTFADKGALIEHVKNCEFTVTLPPPISLYTEDIEPFPQVEQMKAQDEFTSEHTGNQITQPLPIWTPGQEVIKMEIIDADPMSEVECDPSTSQECDDFTNFHSCTSALDISSQDTTPNLKCGSKRMRLNKTEHDAKK